MRISDWSSDVCSADLDHERNEDDYDGGGLREIEFGHQRRQMHRQAGGRHAEAEQTGADDQQEDRTGRRTGLAKNDQNVRFPASSPEEREHGEEGAELGSFRRSRDAEVDRSKRVEGGREGKEGRRTVSNYVQAKSKQKKNTRK